MNENRQAAMVLHRTYDMLSRPRGWVKDQSQRWNEHKDYPAYCISGAIFRAAEELQKVNPLLWQRARSAAQDFVMTAIPSVDARREWSSIPSFNDAARRTKQDVLLVVEKAIILAEESV